MARNRIPKSVRTTAAASVVACTTGLVSQSAEAVTVPVWIDVPAAEGVFVLDSTPFDNLVTIDLDSDGRNDFNFFFYNVFQIGLRDGALNPSTDILFDSVNFFSNNTLAFVSPSDFASRNDVFTAAISSSSLPETVTGIFATPTTDTSIFLGGVMENIAGQQFAYYFELEIVTDDVVLANNSLTIHDAGYALIPEPSSLALLGLGGLLLARRRRG